MKTVAVEGKDCIVLAERNDEDGGIISCVLVPAGDGSYYSHRSWRGAGVEASEADKRAAQQESLALFNAMSGEEIAVRAAKALEPGVSGKKLRAE